jgi:hypothetical protein
MRHQLGAGAEEHWIDLDLLLREEALLHADEQRLWNAQQPNLSLSAADAGWAEEREAARASSAEIRRAQSSFNASSARSRDAGLPRNRLCRHDCQSAKACQPSPQHGARIGRSNGWACVNCM